MKQFRWKRILTLAVMVVTANLFALSCFAVDPPHTGSRDQTEAGNPELTCPCQSDRYTKLLGDDAAIGSEPTKGKTKTDIGG